MLKPSQSSCKQAQIPEHRPIARAVLLTSSWSFDSCDPTSSELLYSELYRAKGEGSLLVRAEQDRGTQGDRFLNYHESELHLQSIANEFPFLSFAN